MDTSKDYVLMCASAEEIQSEVWLGNPKPINKFPRSIRAGDYYFYQSESFGIGQGGNASLIENPNTPMLQIWLPRQDQLQKMIEGEPCAILIKVGEWGQTNDANKVSRNSYEQLWLAFVMHEKYNKTWNGEDWITNPSTNL